MFVNTKSYEIVPLEIGFVLATWKAMIGEKILSKRNDDHWTLAARLLVVSDSCAPAWSSIAALRLSVSEEEKPPWFWRMFKILFAPKREAVMDDPLGTSIVICIQYTPLVCTVKVVLSKLLTFVVKISVNVVRPIGALEIVALNASSRPEKCEQGKTKEITQR